MPASCTAIISAVGPSSWLAVRQFMLAGLLALLTARAGMAQEPPVDSAAAGRQTLPRGSAAAASSARGPVAEIVPDKGLSERVNDLFAGAVSLLDRVLFYRVFSSSRQFIEFKDVVYYRTDEKQPFRKLDASDSGPDALSDVVLAGIQAEGRLDQPPRAGLLGAERTPVEYVKVRHRLGKFVLDQDQTAFHKLLNRERLSETSADIISASEAGQQADEGKLKTDEAGSHVLRETTGGAPVVVLWLAGGAVIFTLTMGFINVRAFRHSISVIRGRYDDPSEPGEVTHFQALASALSATVGLGNIAGVTIAMSTGGPGAFFWMMCCGFFGMTSKFVECTLGQKYRRVKPDGTVLGGPMQYLHEGLAEIGLGPLGLVMSLIFAVMCMMASFGGGNMFQANQSGEQLLSVLQYSRMEELTDLNVKIRIASEANNTEQLTQLVQQKNDLQSQIDSFAGYFKPIYGVVLALMVGVVIIGGIKRIGAAAERVVPTMCLIYVLACLWIIGMHIPDIPGLIGLIFQEAFSTKAFGGGFLGVLVIGVQRAAFSNEAGVGSAAIAHSAARTDEPVREGIVALLEPFIDTIVVCSMTALVILITGAWNHPEWTEVMGLTGAALTTRAFASQIPWFPYLLAVAVVLFAYSTLISWSYYGERCWERLFGMRTIAVYRLLFVCAVVLGAVVNLGAVLDFSDMMILSMAFPNVLGLLLLSPTIRRDLSDYWRRYQAGEFTEDQAGND